jgi:hypothetical protein
MLAPAFEKAGSAAARALCDDIGGLVAISETLAQYAAAVHGQHMELSRQMREVVDTSLSDCAESVEMLQAMCEKMEAAFQRIDDLQLAMDAINDKTVLVNATLKQVEKSADVKERAASMFKSFVGGFKRGGSSGGSSGERDELWSRVPTYAMIDNVSAKDFGEKLKVLFAPFESVKPDATAEMGAGAPAVARK